MTKREDVLIINDMTTVLKEKIYENQDSKTNSKEEHITKKQARQTQTTTDAK